MDEVGPRLRDARAAKNLSLEDIAQATKIPKTSLMNLEAGHWDALPAPVFVRGFIRAYARVVGADPAAMVRLYEASPGPAEHPADGFGNQLGARSGDAPRQAGARPQTGASPIARGPDARPPSRPSAIERQLDPQRKLVPLQPVSYRRDSGLRGGYTLLAVVAVGLLVAAWLLVGGKTPRDTTTARTPLAPLMHERIDGVPSLDEAPPPAGTTGPTTRTR